MASMALTTYVRNLFADRRQGLREEDFRKADPYVREALSENKREGLKLAVRARWAALSVSAVLTIILNPLDEAVFYLAAIALLALIGLAQIRVARVSRSRAEVILIICDIALLTLVMATPNPFSVETWPGAFQFQLVEFSYYYPLLALGVLAYSWRTLTVFAIFTTLFWSLAVIWTVFFGAEYPELTDAANAAFAEFERVRLLFNPNDPQIGLRLQEIVVFLIVVGILLVNGRRSYNLTLRQAGIARERANLSRHFPPNIVDQMADQDMPLGAVRTQNVAAMFVDIVGFSRIAEQQSPEEVVALLRAFHSRLEGQVFAHHGTLDKFLGDGLMATFGTPVSGPDDAANALLCAEAMLKDMDEFNAARRHDGKEAIKISIGLHYGSVILGDIGSARRLEYAVLGDTVNVASRLEALTRSLDARLLVSGDLIRQIPKNDNNRDIATAAAALVHAGAHVLRGREAEIDVWSKS